MCLLHHKIQNVNYDGGFSNITLSYIFFKSSYLFKTFSIGFNILISVL